MVVCRGHSWLGEESRRGAKNFGAGDNNTPTLRNLGKRLQSLKVGQLLGNTYVIIVPGAETIVGMYAHWCAVATTCTSLTMQGATRCKHTHTCKEFEIHRRGGKFQIDAKVVLLFHRHAKPQGRVMINTNLCSRRKMNQIQSRHETLQVNLILLKEKSLVHAVKESHRWWLLTCRRLMNARDMRWTTCLTLRCVGVAWQGKVKPMDTS